MEKAVTSAVMGRWYQLRKMGLVTGVTWVISDPMLPAPRPKSQVCLLKLAEPIDSSCESLVEC